MKKAVNCGDWGYGWGYGGNDKIGKLSQNEDNTFMWRGYSQGRHGQKWNMGAYFHFKMVEGEPDFGIEEIERKGGIPQLRALKQGVKDLIDLNIKEEIKANKARKRVKFNSDNQIKLDI